MTARGLKWTKSGQGHCVWSWLYYGSCRDTVIILAPLIPIHFSCLITSSVCLAVLSQVSVPCFKINIKCVVGGFLSVLMRWKRGQLMQNFHIQCCAVKYKYLLYVSMRRGDKKKYRHMHILKCSAQAFNLHSVGWTEMICSIGALLNEPTYSLSDSFHITPNI